MRRGARYMMMQSLRSGGGDYSPSSAGVRNDHDTANARYLPPERHEINNRRYVVEEQRDMENRYNMDDRYEMENRNRRRYKNGRFAPARNEYRDDHRMEMIGFDTGYHDDTEMRMNKVVPHKGRQERGHGSSQENGLSEYAAKKWVESMKGAGGKGEHYKMDAAHKLMQQRDIKCDPVEFYAILNAVYSDYQSVAKKYGIDRPEFYADLAKAWLEDEDAVQDKASMYYECIVEHEDW